jgi:hypothetical protein
VGGVLCILSLPRASGVLAHPASLFSPFAAGNATALFCQGVLTVSQTTLIKAIDRCDETGCDEHPRKWWSAELGVSVEKLSRWAHDSRPMEWADGVRILGILGRIHPEIAADFMRDEFLGAGLLITTRPAAEPAANSRRAVAAFGREAADVAIAAADADEDGERGVEEIERLLKEQREANAKGTDSERALEQELAMARNVAGVVDLPLRGRRDSLAVHGAK